MYSLMLFCLVIFSYSNHSLANLPGLWRIKPTDSLDAKTLSTRNQFEVEYLGTSNEIQWITSGACQVEDSSSKQTAVSCVTPGFHPITVVEVAQACCNFTNIVKVDEDPFCYQWYLTVANTSSSADVTYYNIKVWIIDNYNAEAEEMKGSAKEPSQNSRRISELFNLKRQEPKLNLVHERTRDVLEVYQPSFNFNCSCWELNMRMPKAFWIYFTITGYTHVSLDSCFIRDTNWVLTQPAFESELEGGMLLVSDPLQTSTLMASFCSPHLAVIIANGNIYLTQNGFLNVGNITVNISLDTYVVKSVAVSSKFLWMLMDNGKILKLDSKMKTQVYELGNITGLTERETCLLTPLYSRDNEKVAAWSNDTIHLTKLENGSMIFQQLSPPSNSFDQLGFKDDYTVKILTAGFAFGLDELMILFTIRSAMNTTSVFLLYNFMDDTWSHFPFAIQGQFTGRVELKFLASSDLSFIFWDRINVYYSFNKGKVNGIMEVRPAGFIQKISISRHDDIVLLTDSNQLYYSYAYSTSFVQLGACQFPDIPSSVYFDVLSRLYIISVRDGDVLRRSYPLLTEVESALYPSFVRFESALHPEIVHLDINEEVDLKVHLIHSTSHADGIQVKVANSHLASLVVQDEMEIFPGTRGIFKTLKIAVSADFAEAYKKSDIQGIMVIEAQPQRAVIESYRPSRMVTQVVVGCPPDRHIRAVKPQTCDTFKHFIIPKSARQGEMTDTIVQYDFGTFGCPIESKHNQLFRPTLHLYDGEKYKEDVSANFMLWELHQRTDYTYNTTMKQARCCRASPSWFGFDELTMSFDTGSQLNASCYTQPCNVTADLSQPYTIMNTSGLSSIKWSIQQDTVFQFRAVVIDTDYSFCVLHTKFAVMVEYIPEIGMSNSVMEMCLILFTSTSLSIAIVSYIYFRKAHIATLNLKHVLPNKDESTINITEKTTYDNPVIEVTHA